MSQEQADPGAKGDDDGIGPIEPDLLGEHHVATVADTDLLDGCLSWFELDTVSTHTAATHLVVVGRVTAMGRGVDAGAADRPLIHFAREYKSIG